MRSRVKQRRSTVWAGVLAAVLVGALLPQVASGAPTERYKLVFRQDPGTVAASPAADPDGAGTSYVPTTVLCNAARTSPLVVEVQDLNGRRVTGRSVVVSLSSSAGLKLQGSGSVAVGSVDGYAVFGTCAAGLTASVLGDDHTITATAGQAAPATSEPFSVLQYFGACAGCSVPALTQDDTTAGLRTATTSGPQELTFSVGVDAWTDGMKAGCSVDGNPYRDTVVTVDLDAHAKTVTLRWSKVAVRWVAENGASGWPVCMWADYQFLAVGGLAPPAAEPSGWYAGRLLACRDVDRSQVPCLDALTKTKRGEQVAVVQLPDNGKDPRFV